METKEVRKRIANLVNKIKDNHFLVTVYELIESRVNENETVDIIDELSPSQLKRLKKAIKQMDTGKGVSHEVAMAKIRKA
jgi:cell fate (sporulation/competence/biofilm development) regulator YmcA (YheA/YmcA/DUF963 family)